MTEQAPASDPVSESENLGTFESTIGKPDGWRKNLLIGIISGLISGIIVSFLLTPTGHSAGVLLSHFYDQPSCNNPQWLMQVPDDQIFSNSFYQQFDSIKRYGIYHSPYSSVDGNLQTAWLQWWPTSNITGNRSSDNYISWTFSHPYDVRLVCVVDGWAENKITFDQTLPIGTADIYSSTSSGKGVPQRSMHCTRTFYRFQDYFNKYTYKWQGIPFSCLTQEVVLHIDNVNDSSFAARHFLDTSQAPGQTISGAKLMLPFTGLSEVRFYYVPSLVSIFR